MDDLHARGRQGSCEKYVHVLDPGDGCSPPAAQKCQELPVAGDRVRAVGVDDPRLPEDGSGPVENGDVQPPIRPVAPCEQQLPTSTW